MHRFLELKHNEIKQSQMCPCGYYYYAMKVFKNMRMIFSVENMYVAKLFLSNRFSIHVEALS